MSSEKFHEITSGGPPRELARKVIRYLGNDRLILDCGSGAGNDSIYFASHGHKVIALDKETSVLENRLNNLTDIKDRITILNSDVMNLSIEEIEGINCFYSSLTLSFLRKKDFYVLWNCISQRLKKHIIIVVNIFGNRDEWYRDTEDMTYMDKEEITSLLSNLTILEFSEIERMGTSMGKDGVPKSKKWHLFECIVEVV